MFVLEAVPFNRLKHIGYFKQSADMETLYEWKKKPTLGGSFL